jgi:hypothetical protein
MTIYKNWVQNNTLIPWRLRHSLESWLETGCWRQHPRLYRWIHFNQFANPVHQVTYGPRHHFFGYYEKSPWNASGHLLLAHEAEFNDRPPQAADSVTVGTVRLDDDNRFVALGKSLAWNWQQGTMLQWHPANPDQWLLHNDRRNGHFLGVLRDTEGRELNTYDRPIYAITPDGRYAYSLNFARLYTHRPGYGYAGVKDPWADDTHPRADGIHRLDLSTGESELIVSLHQLAQHNPRQDMRDMFHWVNHLQVAPGSSRIAFFHIWRIGDTGWRVRFYTADPDGSRLNCLLDTDFISHYDWLDDQHLMIWAKGGNSRGNFLLCDDSDNSKTIIGEGVLTEDGHCSFSPDRRWVLNDTYPDSYGMRTLMLYRWRDGKRIDLARLYSPKERWWGEIRCDLHPRWNRDGKRICIDSVHTGERQMYMIDMPKISMYRT